MILLQFSGEIFYVSMRNIFFKLFPKTEQNLNSSKHIRTLIWTAKGADLTSAIHCVFSREVYSTFRTSSVWQAALIEPHTASITFMSRMSKQF